MNDIDEFLAVMSAIFVGVVLLMVVLTYLETTLVEPRQPRQRIFRKKAATGVHR
jgi:hypothetical protein